MVTSGHTPRMDIPRLRGVTHAYAFWCAVVGRVLLIALTPGGSRAWPRRSTAPACAPCSAAPGSITAGAGTRAGGRSCGGSTTRRSTCSSPPPTRRSALLILAGRRGSCSITSGRARCGGVTLQRRLDHRAAGAVRRALRRARLGGGARVPAAVGASCRSSALILIGPAASSTPSARYLRARAPEPVAAHVRLPRDLPRVRDPGGGRRTSCLAGWIVEQGVSGWDAEYGRGGPSVQLPRRLVSAGRSGRAPAPAPACARPRLRATRAVYAAFELRSGRASPLPRASARAGATGVAIALPAGARGPGRCRARAGLPGRREVRHPARVVHPTDRG